MNGADGREKVGLFTQSAANVNIAFKLLKFSILICQFCFQSQFNSGHCLKFRTASDVLALERCLIVFDGREISAKPRAAERSARGTERTNREWNVAGDPSICM